MSKWYTANRMAEEVLARHYSSESSSEVDHLSCEFFPVPAKFEN
jgi:hypothetical protein